VTGRVARLVVMMVRPPVAAAILLFAALGMAQAGRPDALHPLFTVVPLIVAAWFVHATVLNDLGDEAIDRVNLGHARGRPLVSGHATRAELLALGRAAGLVALVAGWAVNWRVAAVVCVGLALNAAYSVRPLRVCDRGALASALLPAGYVALPYLVGLLAVKPAPGRRDLILLGGLYVAFMGRVVLKDFRDVRGDEMFGKRTFLLRHGATATCRFSARCWVGGSAALLLLVPWWSPAVVAVAMLTGCALHGLRRLAACDDHVGQQVIVAAVAQTGRGTGITLLAHLSMVHRGWPAAAQAVVLATLVLVHLGLYAATSSAPDRAVAMRPY
jgi:4-hydroxybenzoate polyprenyltransferase